LDYPAEASIFRGITTASGQEANAKKGNADNGWPQQWQQQRREQRHKMLRWHCFNAFGAAAVAQPATAQKQHNLQPGDAGA